MMAQASSESGTSRFRVLRSAVAPHGLGHFEGGKRENEHTGLQKMDLWFTGRFLSLVIMKRNGHGTWPSIFALHQFLYRNIFFKRITHKTFLVWIRLLNPPQVLGPTYRLICTWGDEYSCKGEQGNSFAKSDIEFYSAWPTHKENPIGKAVIF